MTALSVYLPSDRHVFKLLGRILFAKDFKVATVKFLNQYEQQRTEFERIMVYISFVIENHLLDVVLVSFILWKIGTSMKK
jgi:hypothetical protein